MNELERVYKGFFVGSRPLPKDSDDLSWLRLLPVARDTTAMIKVTGNDFSAGSSRMWGVRVVRLAATVNSRGRLRHGVARLRFWYKSTRLLNVERIPLGEEVRDLKGDDDLHLMKLQENRSSLA
ncbi:hypothetical protein OROGR_009283 [Orobanche gracilis]